MLKNYFKIALRFLTKNKISSAINIVGLTIGLSVVITIAIFIKYETSYDSFHENTDRIFRLVNGKADDKDSYAGTPAPLGPFLESDIPEIVNSTRLTSAELVVEWRDKKYPEKNFYFVDPSFFEIFSFPLINGNPATALRSPNSIVITEKAAEKYFGSENPIGQIVTIDEKYDFTVSAITKDVPQNSHFHFEFLIQFEQYDNMFEANYKESWGSWNFFTYILLA